MYSVMSEFSFISLTAVAGVAPVLWLMQELPVAVSQHVRTA